MAENLGEAYLESIRRRFETHKELGDRALAQVSDEDLAWVSTPESNSLRVIVQHLAGNMCSRWTDTLTTDGEKPTRNRDGEFEEGGEVDRAAIMENWESGWSCLFNALDSFGPEDLLKKVKIRGQAIPLMDAINRQAMHVPYHVGQIVHICREQKGAQWQTLSIARGESLAYKSKPTD